MIFYRKSCKIYLHCFIFALTQNGKSPSNGCERTASVFSTTVAHGDKTNQPRIVSDTGLSF